MKFPESGLDEGLLYNLMICFANEVADSFEGNSYYGRMSKQQQREKKKKEIIFFILDKVPARMGHLKMYYLDYYWRVVLQVL
jgi:hypothetical protein